MSSIKETSDDPALAGVAGVNTASGPGVWGSSDHGRGVVGVTVDGVGVWGHTQKGRAVVGAVNEEGTGVWGETKTGRAIVGVVNGGEGTAVWGDTKTGRAIVGVVSGGEGTAVWGETQTGRAIVGLVTAGEGTAVWGDTKTGRAIVGVVSGGEGTAVWGETQTGRAIVGVVTAGEGIGVWGESKNGVGVHAKGGKLAAFFEGDVSVTGDILLSNADCAEDFEVTGTESIEPGMVMVLGDDGVLQPSRQAYDKRVAGVVSGAGSYKPGIVLDRQRPQPNRKPIALLGKVYCKVDASHAPIEIGDLLTTAPIPGHAMKATDPKQAFGAVVGKALRRLQEGQGLIPILIALQ